MARHASRELQSLIRICQSTYFDSEVLSVGKYNAAATRLERMVDSLEQAQTLESETLGWRWLFELPSAVLDTDLTAHATMCGEFEHQSALVVPWTTYENVNRVAEQIVKHVWDCIQVDLLIHDESAYDEVVDMLVRNRIPIERIRFSFMQLDSAWIRDSGPIAAKSVSGGSVWFDTQIVRDGLKQRVEADAIPRLLNYRWNSSVYRSPLVR